MVLALGVTHSQQAAQAYSAKVTGHDKRAAAQKCTDFEDGLIHETAKESERIVDIETPRQSTNRWISTLDEVMKIQEEGRQKRRDAKVELTNRRRTQTETAQIRG